MGEAEADAADFRRRLGEVLDQRDAARAALRETEAERDRFVAQVEQLTGHLLTAGEQRDEAHASAELLRRRVIDLIGARDEAHALGRTIEEQRTAAVAEAERLRGLLAEALSGWEYAVWAAGHDSRDERERIRREASLT